MGMGKSKTEIITEYLIETYKPEAIITYGSFGDGSFNENSDFDALVIADHAKYHDVSVVDNTVLDVFVYPVETFEADYDPEEFMQIFDDGRMVEIHSETYPDDIIGIRRISTEEEFGCVVCVKSEGFDENDYEEYEIPIEENTENIEISE